MIRIDNVQFGPIEFGNICTAFYYFTILRLRLMCNGI